MKITKIFFFVFFGIVFGLFVNSNSMCAEILQHEPSTHLNEVPIPMAEKDLPTVIAKHAATANPQNNILEGAIFDNNGNLLFCDVTSRKILSLNPDNKITEIAHYPELAAGGLAFHKDGRLFMASLDLENSKGAIIAWNPKSNTFETIIPIDAGYLPNDLVFDKKGGFYFSDFKGSSTVPNGGIYYVAPDLNTITPVIPNLSQANGVALSPDGKILWATEFGKNFLHRAELTSPTTIATVGSSIPYHFIGPAPDSMRVDIDGNVYVAIYGQGRILVFNKNGIPINQILLPGRENGKNLLSTSLAIHPNSKILYGVSSNHNIDDGAHIFVAPSNALGVPPAISNN